MSMIAKRPIVNALTVDVEDYFHITSFEKRISRRDWDRFTSRVVQNTQRLLDLTEAREIQATFFVLGWVAERLPRLMRQIAGAGHEIGCHSYWHPLVSTLTAAEFRKDIRQTRDLLEGITGERVQSFRAPTFSITTQSLWALDIPADEGFRYDSSILPIYHDRDGIPNAYRFPHRIRPGPMPLWELPGAVHRFWKLNLPISGGGYFRLYPARLTAHWLGGINRRFGQPFMFLYASLGDRPGSATVIRRRLGRLAPLFESGNDGTKSSMVAEPVPLRPARGCFGSRHANASERHVIGRIAERFFIYRCAGMCVSVFTSLDKPQRVERFSNGHSLGAAGSQDGIENFERGLHLFRAQAQWGAKTDGTFTAAK
jgi:polysaccharide deacetylase family protein (PEP-CTERM system associated)